LNLHPPASVLEIAKKLNDAGHETWAVGGAVRDAVLGFPAEDWDLATRARPDTVRALFRRTIPIGIEHGTVGVIGGDGVMYEVTTFRRDVETFGRHAVVEFADTIEEDLARRDFTFNALAWHPDTGEVRDPYAGLEDLRNGVLRTVGEARERFAEDYLRVLRALRFAGQFQLRIDDNTWRALVAATPHLVELSAERVREELMKVLAKTWRASAALVLYESSGALALLYPELQRTVGLEQEEGAPDVWTESLSAIDRATPHRPLLRVALLLHGLGMPSARVRDLRGGWRFTGHEVQGARRAEEVMRRLKASNADVERTRQLVAHQSDLFPPDARGPMIRRWLRQVGPDLVNDLFRLRFALWRARAEMSNSTPEDLVTRSRMARIVIHQHPVITTGGLAIDGSDLKALGLKPGPEFGQILNGLLDRVIEEPELNERETLLRLIGAELGA
jgi:tRNA nucleotidyltransferase (CCA-adding enzyme)